MTWVRGVLSEKKGSAEVAILYVGLCGRVVEGGLGSVVNLLCRVRCGKAYVYGLNGHR